VCSGARRIPEARLCSMTKVNFYTNCCSSEASQNLTVVHSILFADILITGNVKIYSFKKLRKATRNFCPGNKLGQGSFGRVYLVEILVAPISLT